jgi:shikimate dehydrogenase
MGIKAEDYPDFFRSVFTLTNIRGALITMPHKVTTWSWSTRSAGPPRSPARPTQFCGGTTGRLLADQFNGAGFVRGVLRKGFDPSGKRALVVGNGGVGSPIAASLRASDWPGSGSSIPIRPPLRRSPSASACTTPTSRSPWDRKIRGLRPDRQRHPGRNEG